MIMNLLIIIFWVMAIGIICAGIHIKELIEENKKEKAREKLWFI